ncbi:MAG: class I adenylate cyclase [Desulfamplus sp.]|nr:class I adenylate cyclase [Desulfamplus sp.]
MKSAIENNKKNFILHNIVRLREMIRYLPPEKLTLFKMIPFLIHVNSPAFPGYVKAMDSKAAITSRAVRGDNSTDQNRDSDSIFGVWNFENSGFAKDIAENSHEAKELLSIKCHNPAVQAIYHIGSLGTFTQSAKSDFDFWVVIEKPYFQESGNDLLHKNTINNVQLDSYLMNNDMENSNFINMLHEKLSLITTYSRKEFSQEVTFFVHYAHNLRENIFDNPDDEDSVAVPELLLKEEFYRTFIMVAGKIPLWAVQPFGLSDAELAQWKQEAIAYGGFIDLGTFDSMPIEEVQRGLLWQICKAPYDPVKSVIKASITASYNVNKYNLNRAESIKNSDHKRVNPILLCDMVKQRFGESIIDDYAADPYIIAFERIIKFYTELGDQRALSQIKAAIFFRLCGFPLVTLPPKDSPKRKVLDRYVRQWQLSRTRLKKLLEYQIWPEPEKTLFDHTMIERLSSLYKESLEQKTFQENEKTSHEKSRQIIHEKSEITTSTSILNKREADLTILKNKVNKITLKKKDILPKCSTYLRLKPQTNMTLIAKAFNEKGRYSSEFLLFSTVQNSQSQTTQSRSSQIQTSQPQSDTTKKRYNLLYSARYFMEVIGWSMYNHLYIRGTTNLEMRVPFKLYGSLEKISDCDEIYLALQPWMPLSDEPFLSKPVWEKVVVLLFVDNSKEMTQDKNMESIDILEQSINYNMFQQFQKAEFLIRNSWGEIFFQVLNLEQVENPEERCYQTAMKILEYHEKESNYSIFLMASKPVVKLIQKIKTIVEDTKILQYSSEKNSDIKTTQRRPYLDVI